ncbi:MAG: hypothetical protein ABFC80_04350 [Coriobacteriales bacterium]
MHDDIASLKTSLVAVCLERITRSEDSEQAETSALDDVLATLADAMSGALEIFDEQLFSDRPECWRVKDLRSPRALTEFGEVAFTRRIQMDEFGAGRTSGGSHRRLARPERCTLSRSPRPDNHRSRSVCPTRERNPSCLSSSLNRNTPPV